MRKLQEAKEVQKAVISKKKLPKRFRVNNELIEIHWSSVKKFSCLKAIDFALEAVLKFWSIYIKSIPCSSS